MAYSLTKPYPRLWSLDAGQIMVVTDLHGNWDAYQRYRDRFIRLHTMGLADCLIFTGDLIHAEAAKQDHSVEIMSDILALRNTYGSAIAVLCGNHELPHIYGISLAKGETVYTPPFEQALNRSQQRQQIMTFIESFPFFIRTAAGVSLTHAGAAPPVTLPNVPVKLFNWSHSALHQWARNLLEQENLEALRKGYAKLSQSDSYEDLAHFFLDVSGPEDPRYDDLLRGFIISSHPDFEGLLWPTLFTRNEADFGLDDHKIFLDALLQALSTDYYPQYVLVSGHMTIKNGYKIVTDRHLRLASGYHATPKEAGLYLLFDASKPIFHIDDLVIGLGSVYR